MGGGLLLRKGELHRLVALVAPQTIAAEVREKLDLLAEVFPKTTDPEGVDDVPAQA